MRINVASFALFLVLELLLAVYLFLVYRNSSSFVEPWPLASILIETIIIILCVVILAWPIFRKAESAFLFTSIILLTLLIAVPVIKYTNDKLLYGPWDSSAFYSFTKWIVENGRIASNNELYYSYEYGHHPGIAVIPAVIQIITGSNLPLTVSMYLTLVTTYIIYILIFLITLKLLVIPTTSNKLGKYFTTYLVLLSAKAFFMFFYQYYMGVAIGYGYVGLILYVVTLMLIGQGERPVGKLIVLGLLVYMGLLVTHYSTVIIITSYFVILLVSSLLISDKPRIKILIFTFLSVIAILFSYELYVDVYLSSISIYKAFNVLVELYTRESVLATRALEAHASLTYLDLLKYLLSQYIKQILILMLILMHLLIALIKWKTFSKTYKLLTTTFVLSLLTWIIGWAGVGSFMSGMRALALIQFMFALSALYYFLRLTNKVSPSIVIPVALLIIISGFIFNYGIPVTPLIQTKEGDIYIPPLWSQGAVTVWSLHPIEFSNDFLDESSPSFLCIQPYTGFGLCDLLWNKPKIPTHGYTSPQLTIPEEVLKLIYGRTNVVIPIPSSDRVLPGPIGYKSYYLVPYSYCISNCKGKIYTNELYNLFVK